MNKKRRGQKDSLSTEELRITELEREIAELRERERYYRSVFTNSRVSLWKEDFTRVFAALDELGISDPEELRQYFDDHPEKVFELLSLVIVNDVNPATLELFEADSRDDLMKDFARLLPPEAFPFLRDELISLAMGEPLFEGETVNLSLKGQTLYLQVTLIPIEDGSSRRKVLINILDISARHERDRERANTIAQIQERKAFAETMQEITLALNTRTEKNDLLDTIMQQLRRITDYDTACILVEKENSLFVERTYGYEGFDIYKEIGDLKLKIKDYPLMQKMITSRRPMVVPNVREDPLWLPIHGTEFIGSAIQLPLFVSSGFYGILSIEHGEPGFYSNKNLYDLVPFAQTAALAINKAELFERLTHELEEKLRTRRELAASLEQKEILLREIHHRVKNNLSLINGLISLQGSKSGDPEVQSLMNQLQAKIYSISLVHEKLYRSTDLEHMDLREYTRELLDSLCETVDDPGAVSILNQIEEGIRLDNSRIIPLGLILTELFTNSIKYARPEGEDSLVFTLASSGDEDQVTLLVRDNGRGFAELRDIDSYESLGLTLVSSLAKQLGGHGEIVDPSKAEIGITFPRHN